MILDFLDQEPRPMMARADRNLLYGILAVQLDFIGRDALIAAMHAWVLDKSRPLGEILVDQKALKSDRQMLLDALVEEHLKAHDGDAEKSLASLAPGRSTRDRLKAIGDPEVTASLAPVDRQGASFIPTAAPNLDNFKASQSLARWGRRHRAWVHSGVAALVLISAIAFSALVVVDYFRRSESTQKKEVESQIAQIHVNKGLDLCERGEPAQGLLWLARA